LFKATNLTGEHTLLDARKWGTSFGGWNLRVEDGAVKFITVWNDSGYHEAAVSASISSSRTYLVVAVHDGAESRLYLDGRRVGSIKVNGLTENSASTLWIGENRLGKGRLQGTIYVILIYTRALSDSEIQAIYSNPLNPPRQGLVLEYLPSSVDTVNNKWKDLSSNGNDGVIYNASYVSLHRLTEFDTVGLELSKGSRLIASSVNVTSIKTFEFIVNIDRCVDRYDINSDGYCVLASSMSFGTNFTYLLTTTYGKFYLRKGSVYVVVATGKDLHGTHDITIVLDDSSDTATIYVDGRRLWSGGLDIGPTIQGLRFFDSPVPDSNGVPRYQLEGDSYIVRAWNRVLSDSEIAAIYQNPLDPPKQGLVLFYSPYSYNPSTGKWLNVAPIYPTVPLAEELDALNYGAKAERVSIPSLHVYDIENNSEIPVENVSVSLISNNTTISLLPSLLTLPYNETVTLNVSASGYLPRILQFFTPVNTLDVYLQPKNQSEGLDVEQAVNTTELVKNITSYVSITPINPYAKAFMDSGGSFGDTIKLALKGDSLMRLILPQVLILAIVIAVLVQTTSPLAALGGALIGWAMSLGILGEAPSLRNSGMTFMLVVFLVAWTLWDLFYNYSRET